MAVLVGIDEAGYGPILGPLVVSSAVFNVPDRFIREDMWEILSAAVSQNKKHLAGRLLITDSKKAYTRSSGISHLRRSVLTSILAAGNFADKDEVNNAAELLNCLSPDCNVRLANYPWYKDLADQPLGADRDDIILASKVFKKSMEDNGIKLLSLSSQCLDVAHYNHLVDAVKNKASVLFTSICTLIQNAFKLAQKASTGPTAVQVIIDRQGGRTYYQSVLSRMFESFDLKILKEQESVSSYELTGPTGQVMKLHFIMKADQRFLPVSLASMTSKYLREVLVHSINRYFKSHLPGIRPTAGYWKDGLRFINDLKTSLPSFEYDDNILVRSR